jgi:uncharacterized sporulation protein YeaH/YhbH (DUF444 family)
MPGAARWTLEEVLFRHDLGLGVVSDEHHFHVLVLQLKKTHQPEKDSIRHDKRIKEALKQNLKDLIGEESIITSDGKKMVKIPIKYLEQYRFRYGDERGRRR